MKRFPMILAAALPVGIAVWALTQARQAPSALPALAPPGALLYVETPDLAALVAAWRNSEEKRLWLASDNYKVFSRSRLFYRLEQMQQEFAAAAGVSADLPLVEALAGKDSALALYDIGELEFLYIARLESARAMESALWKAGAKFEPRASAGRQYFVRIDPSRRREAAFAAADGWVFVATSENLLAQSLALLSGGGPSLGGEAWFRDALAASGARGDPRMVLNLPALCATPHFRSYWIQRNPSELRRYRTGIVDLVRGAREWREERRLLRPEPVPSADVSGLNDVFRLAPPDAGLVRGWARPAVEAALALLERKVLAPSVAPGGRLRLAPAVSPAEPAGAAVGHDLEARIDEAPPPDEKSEFHAGPLGDLLKEAVLEASLLVQSSRRSGGDAFAGVDTVVVLRGSRDWNAEQARAALASSIEGLYSVSGAGNAWTERNVSGQVLHEAAGLLRIAVAVRGRLLFVAGSADGLAAVLARTGLPAAGGGAVYAADYRHRRELDNFVRMMRMIDHLAMPEEPESADLPRQPMFFSENLASLGTVMGRLDSLSVRVRDSGAVVSETVTYRLNQ